MSQGPHELLDQAIAECLEMCRDTLAIIEERYEDWEAISVKDDRLAQLQAQVGLYGQLVAHLREYAGHAERGRRRPGNLVKQLEAFADQFDAMDMIGEARPTAPQARELARVVESFVPQA